MKKWQNHLNYMEASYSIQLNNLSKYRLSVIKKNAISQKITHTLNSKISWFQNYFE